MERVPLYVFGASAHGKVVAEAARQTNAYVLRGFLDDERAKWGTTFHGAPVLGGVEAIERLPAGARVALGIGANRSRRQVFGRLQSAGAHLATIVHPSAAVSRGAIVGDGTFVGPMAVVHVQARIGRACIINSAAVVEHDNVVDDWVHVSPNATLGGAVTIGAGAHVGMGACVLPNLSIGAWSVVGAGAVVLHPVPDLAVAVGVPARVIRTYQSEEMHTY